MYKSLLTTLEIDFLESFNTLVDTNITMTEALLMIVISFICGFLISLTYMKTSENGNYSKNFALTMVLLPVIISSIIMLIGSDIARAFSLAGAFAIIRFRSEPGEPKDIAYVLFSMAAGLALGISEYIFAVVFTVILCVFMYILLKTKYATPRKEYKRLKITIPEDLNYELEFKDVFEKYTVKKVLKKVQTASLGSLYQVYYDVLLKPGVNSQEFIDDLRIINSNLDISMTLI